MAVIKIATEPLCEHVQPVFNHKDVLPWLGGFTMLEQMKANCRSGRPGLWYAVEDTVVVGAMMVAGRPAAFQMKYGSVGVVPDWRRKRISTALYFALTCQGVLEGRRLFEDSIVADNPVQFMALPAMGLNKVGTLRHKTGSGKGICLFDFSLLEEGAFEKMAWRVHESGHHIHVLENFYTREVREANISAYKKQLPAFVEELDRITAVVRSLPFVHVFTDTSEHPTDARRKRFQAQRSSLLEGE